MTPCSRRFKTGSSPRVWGQVLQRSCHNTPTGIIPTRVGTSRQEPFRVGNAEDHPHACGDKGFTACKRQNRIGSSPRVWGQVEQVAMQEVLARIIPTRVGTSRYRFSYCGRNRDHPHACGDKTKEIKENSGFAKSTA